jgi:hypothetical protein
MDFATLVRTMVDADLERVEESVRLGNARHRSPAPSGT